MVPASGTSCEIGRVLPEDGSEMQQNCSYIQERLESRIVPCGAYELETSLGSLDRQEAVQVAC